MGRGRREAEVGGGGGDICAGEESKAVCETQRVYNAVSLMNRNLIPTVGSCPEHGWLMACYQGRGIIP